MTPAHAIITGGSGEGIGRSSAPRLAAAGIQPSLVARRKELLAEAATDVASHFTNQAQRIFTYSADISKQTRPRLRYEACIASSEHRTSW
jgi:NAD(P)-dependent dehydrogenase (short-subunit alcohol dehydrogenase family)